MSTTRDGRIRSDAITDVERPWMELVEKIGIVRTRDALVQHGFTPAQAAGIAVWLDDRAHMKRDLVSERTVMNYRRSLRVVASDDVRAIPG